jgi:hypothetical protein
VETSGVARVINFGAALRTQEWLGAAATEAPASFSTTA